MAPKPTNTRDSGSAALKKAIVTIFQKHPTRNFNYKQVVKLIEQLDPVLFAKHLYIDDRASNREIMNQMMAELVISGDLIETDPGRYKAVPVQQFIEGVIDITSTGMAYVMNENYEEDIVIAPHHTLNALKGDVVKVLLSAARKSGRQQGKVIEIVKRSKTDFAGTVQVSDKFAFLVPDGKGSVDLFIPLNKLNGATDGQKAVARMLEWPEGTKNPIAEIVEILGMPGDNNTEMNAILIEYGFPIRFPDDVEKEAEAIPFEIPASEIKKRRDMRTVTTFTIDPVDAKDFDDALSVQQLEENVWEIGIHIADVSYYLKPGSNMDDEAFDRGTSVYLVDRVIPMLPEKLSNNVCSLRPNEDKLCYSAVFKIDANAVVLDEWFGRTVIHSDVRFAYEDAQKVIENKEGTLSAEILLLDGLAKKMRAERFKQGAITFEKVEIKFLLDNKGNPTGVYTKENKDSNKLIEEFMLLANRKVAEFIGKHNVQYPLEVKTQTTKKPPTFVYRIHDSPVSDKLEKFSVFASRFGYKINTRTDKDVAHSLNQLMKNVKGKKEQNVLEQLAIRTMSKAVYTTENIGHYGLAFDFYTHFTSPIRRYPDVMVHRLLDHYMKGGKSVDSKDYEEMCKHATDMEIKASEAERASVKYKQVQYLQSHKDEFFDGIISGVTEWGFYVELTLSKCEGLVRLRDIGNDFYELDEENYCITGHRSGNAFRLGDEVKVAVKNTDLARKQIDFVLHDFEEGFVSKRPENRSNKFEKRSGGNDRPKRKQGGQKSTKGKRKR